MKRFSIAVAVVAIVAGMPGLWSSVEAAVVTVALNADRDNYLLETSGFQDFNDGAFNRLFMQNNTNNRFRTLVGFEPLPGGLTSALIGSAVVRVELKQAPGDSDTIEVRALTQDWTELGSTWNTYDGSNAWPGGAGALGDTGAVLDTEVLTGIVQPDDTFIDFDVTSAVKDWADGTPNYGVLFNSIRPTDAGASTEFWARESDQTGPQLIIEVVPEPASVALTLLGVGAMACRRRRGTCE